MNSPTLLSDADAIGDSARKASAGLALAGADLSAPVSGSFIPGIGLLTVLGDNAGNQVVIGRDAYGAILVNGGAVPVTGGVPTVANTTAIQVFGRGGDDVIALDETHGALPAATLFGGAGNDKLTGGSAADLLFGQSGDDTLNGKGGNDLLFGGDGNDLLTGGAGDDQLFGETGNDRFVWGAGDGSDTIDGGAGIDSVDIDGGNGAETFTIFASGSDHVRVDRITPAPFNVDTIRVESIFVDAGGGDDIVSAGNGLRALVQLTIDGGAGNDTITGGDGDDTLLGGSGDDLVNGGRGADTVLLGAGADSFVWNPGDGNDVVEGQAGSDALLFNGSNVAETIDISANGARVLVTRNVGAATMDLRDVETIAVNAKGGADTINVHDLSGTGVQQVSIDLAGAPGQGDGAADLIDIQGTAGDDAIRLSLQNGMLVVDGLAAQIVIANFESGDRIHLSGLGGDDVIDASLLPAGATILLDGGDGDDVLIGGDGNDILIGGAGDDVLIGGPGQDVLDGGSGDNVLIQ